MNKELLALLNQPFLCEKESLKTLFQIALSKSDLKANIGARSDYTTDESVNISIHGVMFRYKNIFTELGYGVSTEEIKEKIQKALNANKHVNLVIDSGGGVVNGMSEFANFIYANRNNITAYVKGYCASAAFWAGSSARKLFVEETSMLGSVGVVVTMADFTKAYENLGIVLKDITNSQSPNKRIDIKTQKGEDEVKKQLDGLADIFISSVARNRNLSNDEIVKGLEYGGVITGKEAVKRQIADGIVSIKTTYKEKSMGKETMIKENVEKSVALEESANLEAQREEIAKEKEAIAREKERMVSFKIFDAELSEEDKTTLEAQGANSLEVQMFVLKKRMENQPKVPFAMVGEDLSKKSLDEDVENALIMNMGVNVENATKRSLKLANGSLKAVLGEFGGLGLANKNNEFMGAMTTTDFPILLTNAVNRVLVDSFETQPVTYEAIVEKVAHKDFKPQQSVELQHIQPSVFKEIVEGGELKAFSVKEHGEISAIASYGAKYSLTRQMLYNDDLGAFAKLFQGFGYSSRHLINSLVYQLLEGRGVFENYKLNDGKAFFDNSRKNIAKTKGAISKDTISEMRTALGRQTDNFGEPKAIMPEFILTPLELQTEAEMFLNSSSIIDTNNANIVNPFKNKFTPITDARIQDAKAWYLGAKGAVKLGYLQDTRGIPQIEIVDKNMVDGITWACLIDFKVYAGDPKRIIKNTGV